MGQPGRLLLVAALSATPLALAAGAVPGLVPGGVAGPPPLANPSPVSAQAAASKAELTVGEPFAIEVKALGPPGTTFSFPGEASAEGFDLRPASAPGSAGAAPQEPGVRRYQATLFALGDVEIPALTVRYRLPDGTEGETATKPIALRVRSSLPKSADERKLVDIRGPVAVSVGRAFWIALGALVALVAALVFWLVRRRRTVPARLVAAAPELPPADEALRALDALGASDLLVHGEYRSFYIQLTAVAKRYLERRLGAPVLEMTSAETLAFLRGHPHGGDLFPTVRDLADAADRIKFAKGAGLREEGSRHLAAVRALVSTLEQRLLPKPDVGQAA